MYCIANNINRNMYMYLNYTHFPTTGYARVLLFMFIRRELAEERYRMFISVYILCNGDMHEVSLLDIIRYTGVIHVDCPTFNELVQ